MPQLNPEFFLSQLFWLVLTFTFLLIFLWRISLPRISTVLEKRESKINNDLEIAKEMQDEAEKIQAKIENELRNNQDKASNLIKNTKLELQQIENESLVKLDQELDNKLIESSKLIEKNKKEAINKIQDEIVEITNLTLSKFTSIKLNNKEIKEIISNNIN